MTSLYLSTLNFKLSTITMTMAVDDDYDGPEEMRSKEVKL